MKIIECLFHGLWYSNRKTVKVVDEGKWELLPTVSLQMGTEKTRDHIL